MTKSRRELRDKLKKSLHHQENMTLRGMTEDEYLTWWAMQIWLARFVKWANDNLEFERQKLFFPKKEEV